MRSALSAPHAKLEVSLPRMSRLVNLLQTYQSIKKIAGDQGGHRQDGGEDESTCVALTAGLHLPCFVDGMNPVDDVEISNEE
jgi:hypothetical protein